MNLDDIQRMSWSVSQRLPLSDTRADLAFSELVASCCELVQRNFAEDDGFELAAFALRGPVEGARFIVQRGRMRFLLSVQRFERAHTTASHESVPVEIRLVGSMGLLNPSGASSVERTLAGWGVAGCALGTLGVSALALGSAGHVSAWLQAALLLPALVAWRTCTTIGMARSLRRQAEIRSATHGSDETVAADAVARWRQIAPALIAERELIGERLGLPPFRNAARAMPCAPSSAA